MWLCNPNASYIRVCFKFSPFNSSNPAPSSSCVVNCAQCTHHGNVLMRLAPSRGNICSHLIICGRPRLRNAVAKARMRDKLGLDNCPSEFKYQWQTLEMLKWFDICLMRAPRYKICPQNERRNFLSTNKMLYARTVSFCPTTPGRVLYRTLKRGPGRMAEPKMLIRSRRFSLTASNPRELMVLVNIENNSRVYKAIRFSSLSHRLPKSNIL